ncbi:hypothetical protein BD324DRAFT_616754 [Kockovaella imperatae]|uniref:Pentacotripeptide-repeat region of PRORP domain-containing protein n=1 Tax=Kockovaella imperatae TaxID=4999 RepID=A0A1Y1UQ66_9TREE|nr:hypothetical protein BD324DRAFT_616754 [Kockovaella imperatae]ORX40200.1 hypothetical protein BD324DRAFT_616754 [Kockovaella imperatae]
MLASRRLATSCLTCGPTRILIPHAESSRQAILRDTLLRRRNWVQVHGEDDKGKMPIRSLHSASSGSGSRRLASAAAAARIVSEEEEDELEMNNVWKFELELERERASFHGRFPRRERLDQSLNSPRVKEAHRNPNPPHHASGSTFKEDWEVDDQPVVVSSDTVSLRSATNHVRRHDPFRHTDSSTSTEPWIRGRQSQRSTIRADLRATPDHSSDRQSIEHDRPPDLHVQETNSSRQFFDSDPFLHKPWSESMKEVHDTHQRDDLSLRSPSTSTAKVLQPMSETALANLRVSLKKDRNAYNNLVNSDPVKALVRLPTLPVHFAETFDMNHPLSRTAFDMDRLFQLLERKQTKGTRLSRVVSRDQAQASIEWLCGSTSDSVVPHFTKVEDADPASVESIVLRTQRGVRFRHVLHLCHWLEREDLAVPLFTQVYGPLLAAGPWLDGKHFQLGKRPVATAALILDLAQFLKSEQYWDYMISLFAHRDYPEQPSNVPMEYWTPHLLSKVMLAYTKQNKSSAVVALWQEYQSHGRPKPTRSTVYERLMTAHLRLGNMRQVRKYQKLSKDEGFNHLEDELSQATHLAQAQRQYGMDLNLEAQVLDVVKAAESRKVVKAAESRKQTTRAKDKRSELVRRLSATAINELVQLRLDSQDTQGAANLLHHFSLPILPRLNSAKDTSPERKFGFKPTRKTFVLAFEVFSQLRQDEEAEKCWRMIVEDRLCPILTDSHIARFTRHMSRCGRIQEAFDQIRRRLRRGKGDHQPSVEEQGPSMLPAKGFEIGTRTMNALLYGMGQQLKVEGLVKVIALMQDHHIDMDAESVRWILRCLSLPYSGQSDDHNNLAEALSLILRHAKIPEDAAKDLESAMSRAMSKYNETLATASDPVAGLDFQTSGLGLRLVVSAHEQEAHKIEVQPVIKDLTAKWLTSDSTAFAYRLEFEAMTDDQVGGVSSARALWDQLVSRGYRMNPRHLLGLIKGYVSAGKMDAATAVVDMARQSNLPLTRAMLVALMNGWGDRREISKAGEVFEQIRLLGQSHPTQGIDEHSICAMIKIYSRAHRRNEARALIHNDLLPRYPKLDDVSVLVVGRHYLSANQPSTAVKFVHHYRPEGELDRRIATLLDECAQKLRQLIESKRATRKDREAYEMITQMLRRTPSIPSGRQDKDDP